MPLQIILLKFSIEQLHRLLITPPSDILHQRLNVPNNVHLVTKIVTQRSRVNRHHLVPFLLLMQIRLKLRVVYQDFMNTLETLLQYRDFLLEFSDSRILVEI